MHCRKKLWIEDLVRHTLSKDPSFLQLLILPYSLIYSFSLSQFFFIFHIYNHLPFLLFLNKIFNKLCAFALVFNFSICTYIYFSCVFFFMISMLLMYLLFPPFFFRIRILCDHFLIIHSRIQNIDGRLINIRHIFFL